MQKNVGIQAKQTSAWKRPIFGVIQTVEAKMLGPFYK